MLRCGWLWNRHGFGEGGVLVQRRPLCHQRGNPMLRHRRANQVERTVVTSLFGDFALVADPRRPHRNNRVAGPLVPGHRFRRTAGLGGRSHWQNSLRHPRAAPAPSFPLRRPRLRRSAPTRADRPPCSAMRWSGSAQHRIRVECPRLRERRPTRRQRHRRRRESRPGSTALPQAVGGRYRLQKRRRLVEKGTDPLAITGRGRRRVPC